MPLTAEITGDEHPKTVTIVSDDEDALNMDLIDTLRNVEWNDLAERFEGAELDAAGLLKVTLEPGEVGEFMDVLEDRFPGHPATADLTNLRDDAVAEAERKLAGD